MTAPLACIKVFSTTTRRKQELKELGQQKTIKATNNFTFSSGTFFASVNPPPLQKKKEEDNCALTLMRRHSSLQAFRLLLQLLKDIKTTVSTYHTEQSAPNR